MRCIIWNKIKIAIPTIKAFSRSLRRQGLVLGVVASIASAASTPAATVVQSDWPDSIPAGWVKTVLVEWDFENVPAMNLYNSVAPSFVSPLVASTDITGPGQIFVGPMG
jgi:hypothetical protein